jgi:hypothetical protein
MLSFIRRTCRLAAIVVLAGVCAVAVAQHSDDKKPGMDAAQPPGGEDMMKKFMEMNKPNEHHKTIAMMAGQWDVQNTMQMAPGAPPQVSTGKSSNEMIFEGRFLMQKYDGNMMNMPFKGIGFLGYDNHKKKHVSTWLDSMSTGMMTSWGECDASGKVITFTNEMDDPMSGKKMPIRFVFTIEGNDKHRMDWYETHDGNEFKSMTIVYTRAK